MQVSRAQMTGPSFFRFYKYSIVLQQQQQTRKTRDGFRSLSVLVFLSPNAIGCLRLELLLRGGWPNDLFSTVSENEAFE